MRDRHTMTCARCLFFVLLLLLCAAPILAQDDTSSVIRHQESLLNTAWDHHVVSTADHFYAEDFRGISHSGHTLTKKDVLAAIQKNDETDSAIVDEEHVTDLGNTAIYNALITDKGKNADGTLYSVRTRVTDVWVNRHGRWVLVASQETIVKD